MTNQIANNIMRARKVASLAALVGMAVLAALVLIATPIASGRTTHVLDVTDEGHLHLNRNESSGELLIEEGTATGRLPCKVKVRLYVGETISATITIYPRGGGAITASGHETLHYSTSYTSFGGSITVTGGSGPYGHAHGSGGLYGVISRQTDAVTVQTTGKLYY